MTAVTEDALELVLFAGVIFKIMNECTSHRVVDYVRAVFTLAFASFFIYTTHRYQHKHPDSMFGKLHALHHNPNYKNKWYVEVLEGVNNSQLLLLIIVNNVITKVTNVQLFSNVMFVFLTCMYLVIHLVQYKVSYSCSHAKHHEYDSVNGMHRDYAAIKNYAPYVMDNLFKTNAYCSTGETSLNVFAIIALFRTYVVYCMTIWICKHILN